MRVPPSAFPEHVVFARFRLADGYCECFEPHHGHAGRCAARLRWQKRGRESQGSWEAHHDQTISRSGNDSLANCRIYCWECHKQSLEGVQALSESEQ